ncbi:hypothetical protein GCM10010234_27300 [Streptomyces hawaiiensis]
MPAPAYREKGTCTGVSARSGWRVNGQSVDVQVDRAVPRTDTPRRGPDPGRNRRCSFTELARPRPHEGQVPRQGWNVSP